MTLDKYLFFLLNQMRKSKRPVLFRQVFNFKQHRLQRSAGTGQKRPLAGGTNYFTANVQIGQST